MYKDVAQNQDLYDTSDYPQDHPLYSSANKKVLGKLKDKCAGCAIAEYVGLRPKMYSILEAGGKKHLEGERHKKECREEAHQAQAVRRGPLQKANLPPQHGCPAVRAPSHLRAKSEQGLYLHFDSKRWIAKHVVDTFAYGHRDAVPGRCQAGAGMDAYIEELFNA